MLELKFAKQTGLPLVPVMLSEDPKWKASGWLGICTAGSLWTPLDEADFEGSIDRLAAQVQSVAADSLSLSSSSDTVDAPTYHTLVQDPDATKAEFERLREEVVAATGRAKPIELQPEKYDPDQPAVVPQQVPQLPRDFRETPAIAELRRMLCATKVDGTVQRVGFWGRGGIGKTVASAALLRDTSIREHYDQILFLALGQTPVMDKVRGLMYLQLTGMQLKVDWSEQQKIEAIRMETTGRRILLYLDDL